MSEFFKKEIWNFIKYLVIFLLLSLCKRYAGFELAVLIGISLIYAAIDDK